MELEHIPFYMYTLDGFDVILEHVGELASEVEKYLRTEPAKNITRYLVEHDANPPDNIEKRVNEILRCIVVSVVDYGARDKSQGKHPIVLNIHCASPTRDAVLWEEWHDGLQSLGAPTTYGFGKARKHMRCDMCHGADHPTHIYPYAKLRWYDNPTPPRVRRAAARVQPQNGPTQGGSNTTVRTGRAVVESGQTGHMQYAQPRPPMHTQQAQKAQQTQQPL